MTAYHLVGPWEIGLTEQKDGRLAITARHADRQVPVLVTEVGDLRGGRPTLVLAASTAVPDPPEENP